MAAVALAGAVLTACSSSTPSAFDDPTPLPGSAIPARVIADDRTYVGASSTRPRFVPCSGLSGCARSTPGGGDAYPGVTLPTAIDSQVEFDTEFVLYLVDAAFEEATFDDRTVHIRVRPRDRGFQMVKLNASEVFSITDPTFSFQDEDGKVICTSSWEGCG